MVRIGTDMRLAWLYHAWLLPGMPNYWYKCACNLSQGVHHSKQSALFQGNVNGCKGGKSMLNPAVLPLYTFTHTKPTLHHPRPHQCTPSYHFKLLSSNTTGSGNHMAHTHTYYDTGHHHFIPTHTTSSNTH